MLKGGRDVHLEINEIWHMKTVALLIKIIKRNTVFEKLKPWAGIFKYAKDMEGVRSPSLMLSTFRTLNNISKSLNFPMVPSKVQAPESSICQVKQSPPK